jgi:hypothetical protein
LCAVNKTTCGVRCIDILRLWEGIFQPTLTRFKGAITNIRCPLFDLPGRTSSSPCSRQHTPVQKGLYSTSHRCRYIHKCLVPRKVSSHRNSDHDRRGSETVRYRSRNYTERTGQWIDNCLATRKESANFGGRCLQLCLVGSSLERYER